jgi:orotate phosphoribosyltransferase
LYSCHVHFKKGDSVVVIEDTVTSGGSAIAAIDAIEKEGGKVAFVAVLVEREEGGRQKIEAMGHPVVALFSKGDLLGNHARSPQPADCAVA